MVLDADWIVLGPGSWFTSVIPHLLVPELADAIHSTPATRILTLNLEPRGGDRRVLARPSTSSCWPTTPRICAWTSCWPTAHSPPTTRTWLAWADSLGAELVVADLAARDGSPRHDPLRLASAYAEIMGI